MPRVPLTNAHGKRVEILVHLIQEGNRLDYHVVRAGRVELHLAPRVGVAKTALGVLGDPRGELLDKFVKVAPDPADNLTDNFVRTDWAPKALGNCSCETSFHNTDGERRFG